MEDFPPLESHALRVRGLKLIAGTTLSFAAVARSTRAWIETPPGLVWRTLKRVARSTRAWIET